MAKDVEPKFHSSGSRMYNATGEAAGTGFRMGLLGGLLGIAAVAGLGAGIGVLLASSTLPVIGGMALSSAAIGGAIAGTIMSAVPAAVGAIGGGLIGAFKGSQHAGRKMDAEQYAAREQLAYQQTAQTIQAQQYMQAQPPMVMAAPANDNPYHQAASQIDAASVAHQQTVSPDMGQEVRV